MHFVLASGFSVFAITSFLLEYWKITHESLLINVELLKKTQFILVEDERFLHLDKNASVALHWKILYGEEDNVICLCDGYNESKIEPLVASYTAELLDYYYRDEIPLFFRSHENLYSCMIFDMASNKVTLISDNIGSRPLFYSVSGSEEEKELPTVFVTSDLLIGIQLGFVYMNSVPSQHYITINMTSGSVISLKSIVVSWSRAELFKEDTFSDIVLSSVTNVINSSLLSLNFSKEIDSLIMEDNELMWSNMLLSYALQNLNLSSESRQTKRRPKDSEGNSSCEFGSLTGTSSFVCCHIFE
jgi:hypothetical protein